MEGEPEPPSKRNSALDKWIETVDTRKMTLAEYKKFLQLQQEQGD